jgi:hypothetical protein
MEIATNYEERTISDVDGDLDTTYYSSSSYSSDISNYSSSYSSHRYDDTLRESAEAPQSPSATSISLQDHLLWNEKVHYLILTYSLTFAASMQHFTHPDPIWFFRIQFQALLERPVANQEEALERAELINSFVEEFVEAATPFVKTVVEEEHLPIAQRTIQPINIGTKHNFSSLKYLSNASPLRTRQGGIAGGTLPVYVSSCKILM